MGVFDYQSGNRQGNLIDVLSMNPAIALRTRTSSFNCILCVFNSRTPGNKCSSNLMLSDEIEVLNVIEDHDIPLHVLCHAKLKLYPLRMLYEMTHISLPLRNDRFHFLYSTLLFVS